MGLTMSKERIVVSDDLSSFSDNEPKRDLNLMMICCEENRPYGPAEKTADMFLQLFTQAYRHLCGRKLGKRDIKTISITIYHARYQDYPSKDEWDNYDGILIPGSLSSAYDTHIPWIQRLHTVIREEIHAKQRKTLAVCFGHQAFAHALGCVQEKDTKLQRNGEAVKCPTGCKVGTKSFDLTPAGIYLLSKLYELERASCDSTNTEFNIQKRTSLEMLYTHGDMVNSLPPTGISLGGNADVPIQSAAYFATEEDALKFRTSMDSPNESSSDSHLAGIEALPYAITFQSHPEYVSPIGFDGIFVNVLSAMERKKLIDHTTSTEAYEDADLPRLRSDSLYAIDSIGLVFGWI